MKDSPESELIALACANIPWVEALYARYEQDPKSVDAAWVNVFKAFEKTTSGEKDARILLLIDGYRRWGHLAVNVNPISSDSQVEPAELRLENFGLSSSELEHSYFTHGLISKESAPLREIVEALQSIYCSRIGFEYMGMQGLEFEKWLQELIEPLDISLTADQKRLVASQLAETEQLENFLHVKFPGQKRFSIEGCETLIPMLAAVIEKGAELGTEEYVLGMSHRGRLSVLVNILHKSYQELFSEFDEGYFPDSFEGSGDVKYHRGFLSDVVTIHGHQVQLSLTPNPSHLESVDAVVEGQVKAKQVKQTKAAALLVHGDAAIAGQGVVYETLQLYKLPEYATGGTIHLVVNNQLGFTTNPQEGRSTRYCTDIAKTFGMPVFHVNAEDPEACVFVAYLAAALRHQFKIDVFIDLNCYRKFGHNEGDEPAFTQPLVYQSIRSKKSIAEIFYTRLFEEKVIQKAEVEKWEENFKKSLQVALKSSSEKHENRTSIKNNFQEVGTGVDKLTLIKAAERLCFIPTEFSINPKLGNLLKERFAMLESTIDWGMAEQLALATLAWEGISIRLSGQDSGRGTFSHRHALWVDQKKGTSYYPLSHLKAGQGRVDVINSPLSEFASMGFEYGYSIANPEALVIWEAQFGDFSNGAQVVIDQYISCAEQKWGQKSSLTLLLPHGYEGQGPEHSSARLERFLSLAGNDNMRICNPTTPSQLFHLLRRQRLNHVLKPLVCLTPKALLRHPQCVSALEELEAGVFATILEDPIKLSNAKKLLLCSGKIFYELAELRQKDNLDFAIVRIEQLYPLDGEKLKELLNSYTHVQDFIWIQEEPKNMGAWSYVQPLFEILMNKKLQYIGRQQSASPATGSYHMHKQELQMIINALIQGNR